MKKFLIPVFSLFSFFAFSQEEANIHRCLTDFKYEEFLKANPSAIKNLEEAEKIANAFKSSGSLSKSGTVIIIPVVFHVFHTFGTENISKAQIEDQLRILNEDFRRMNADASSTRAAFTGVATDMEIEFRLAQKDPDGNCTDGIVRVYEPKTVNADDAIKSKSRWDSKKYLNIWTVSSIKDTDTDPNTTTLGYAQFPWDLSSSPGTDGLIIRADYIGSIGTSSAGRAGRTGTHEIGHWIGLFHPFQGACNPGGTWGENITDTPPVASPSFGCNLSRNSCATDNPNLPDQIENFMDYANGSCQNMFTAGQKNRMLAMMSSYRSQVYSASNLSATGVDQGAPGVCAPIAEFINASAVNGCEGFTVSYKDYSFNGPASSWEWTFPGGTPSVSTDQNPTVKYETVGTYNVTLKVSNAFGSNTKTRNMLIQVEPAVAIIKAPIAEGIESGVFPPPNWQVVQGGGTITWARTMVAKKSGTYSLFMNNFSNTVNNKKDAFISPSFDLTNSTNAQLSFYVSYAQRASGVNDALSIYVSTDCGLTWSPSIFSKFGAGLATVPMKSTAFYPSSATDWKLYEIDMSAYKNSNNVKVKFESMSRSGNNLFVDDINILGGAGQVGIDPVMNAENTFNVFPNPFTESAEITYSLPANANVSLTVYDMMGRVVATYAGGGQVEGNYSFTFTPSAENNAEGLYIVRLNVNDTFITRKLLLTR